jgi:hypothetical protein
VKNKINMQSTKITNDIMLDIETRSTAPNASILSIGAIRFDRHGPMKPLDEMDSFYVRIDLQSCDDLGMDVNPGTVEWWKKQDKVIYDEAFGGEDRVSITEALIQLKEWIGGGTVTPWGNGDDFDCVILDQAYKAISVKTPWDFWNTRDVRTVLDLVGIMPWHLLKDNKHHPINDCYRQIDGIKRAFAKLGLYTK